MDPSGHSGKSLESIYLRSSIRAPTASRIGMNTILSPSYLRRSKAQHSAPHPPPRGATTRFETTSSSVSSLLLHTLFRSSQLFPSNLYILQNAVQTERFFGPLCCIYECWSHDSERRIKRCGSWCKARLHHSEYVPNSGFPSF